MMSVAVKVLGPTDQPKSTILNIFEAETELFRMSRPSSIPITNRAFARSAPSFC